MNRKKILGYLAVLVGVILLICGARSSKHAHSISGHIPGHTMEMTVKKNGRHFDKETITYLVVGVILLVGGGASIYASKKHRK